MRLQFQLEQRPLKRDEHGEIAAARTPIRMDAATVSLFRELAGFSGGRCSGCGYGSLGVNLMYRNRKAGLTGQLRFHCFDNVVRHKRLAVVLADVTVGIETGFAPEITGELAALIVLNQDHILAAPENGADLRRVQWHDPFNGELIGHDAFFAREFFHRFPDYARGRAPTHQRDIGLLWTKELRRRDVLDRA